MFYKVDTVLRLRQLLVCGQECDELGQFRRENVFPVDCLLEHAHPVVDVLQLAVLDVEGVAAESGALRERLQQQMVANDCAVVLEAPACVVLRTLEEGRSLNSMARICM